MDSGSARSQCRGGCSHRPHSLHHSRETCFCTPSVMSTWLLMQLTHILVGLGATGTPHRQHSLRGRPDQRSHLVWGRAAAGRAPTHGLASACAQRWPPSQPARAGQPASGPRQLRQPPHSSVRRLASPGEGSGRGVARGSAADPADFALARACARRTAGVACLLGVQGLDSAICARQPHCGHAAGVRGARGLAGPAKVPSLRPNLWHVTPAGAGWPACAQLQASRQQLAGQACSSALRRPKGPNWHMLVPLVYAPALPLRAPPPPARSQTHSQWRRAEAWRAQSAWGSPRARSAP